MDKLKEILKCWNKLPAKIQNQIELLIKLMKNNPEQKDEIIYMIEDTIFNHMMTKIPDYDPSLIKKIKHLSTIKEKYYEIINQKP